MSRNSNAADNTPPWLREELSHDNAPAAAPAQSYTPPKIVAEPKVASSGGGAEKQTLASSAINKAADTAGITLPTQEDVPKMILYTRVLNLALSVGMLIASLLSLLTTTDATNGVLACYTLLFSCLLCCYETHLKQVSKLVAKNFGFLYSAKSRCLFMVFIGTIMFSFSLFGKLIGLLMLANACFNAFLLCMYPQFDDLQRKDAQAEIQEYLAANPAYAAQALNMGVAAGATIAANNPGKLVWCYAVLILCSLLTVSNCFCYLYLLVPTELANQGMQAVLKSQTGGYAKVNDNAV